MFCSHKSSRFLVLQQQPSSPPPPPPPLLHVQQREREREIAAAEGKGDEGEGGRRRRGQVEESSTHRNHLVLFVLMYPIPYYVQYICCTNLSAHHPFSWASLFPNFAPLSLSLIHPRL